MDTDNVNDSIYASLGPPYRSVGKPDVLEYDLSFAIILTRIEMSFRVPTVIMSNAQPNDYQGMADSIVSTVVNYSINFGLGLAVTV